MNQLAIDFSGRDIGHARAKAAADHAGAEWKEQALAALLSYASTHKKFTVEQVGMHCKLPDPPSKRAWGAIALAAQRMGVIRSLGTTKVNDGRMFATLWGTV